MRSEKVLPFEMMLDYVEGNLDAAARQWVEARSEEDEQLKEMLEGIEMIIANEGMDRAELEESFHCMACLAEKTIQLHYSFSNHLIELNQQLRAAAAIFILIFPLSLMLLGAIQTGYDVAQSVQSGPYDLALGMKIAP